MRRGFSWTLVLILFCALLGGALVRRQAASVIGKGAALEIALDDAGLTRSQTSEKEVDYDHGYYTVEFESGRGFYFYVINAHTGEILNMEIV